MNESSFRKTPPPKVKTSKRPDAPKRQRILDAAALVFAEHGFHGTRISDIAKLAHVADGTIYLYFDSKQALMLALFDETIQQFFGDLQQQLQPLHSARDKLRQLIRAQLSLLDQKPALARLLTVNLRQSHGAVREHVTPTYDAYLNQVSTLISEGQRRGEFRPEVNADLAARAIFGALDGIILAWVMQGTPRPALSNASEGLSELIFNGLEQL